MANITIITVGTLKEDYLKEAVSEYKKRLSQYAKVDEITIKEERISNEEDIGEIKKALDSEGEKIISQIPKESKKIALCVEGKEYDSPSLANVIGKFLDESGKVTFIIGSSHGLSDKVKNICDLKLSFSKLTFPHQLMRVVLAEALYRSFTILAGKKYHK